MKKRLLVTTIIMIFTASLLYGCGSTEADSSAPQEAVTEAQPEAESISDESAGAGIDNEAYKAYYDLVSNIDSEAWDRFALIDLNGDGTAELFATNIDGERLDPSIQPYMVAGYGENGIQTNEDLMDGVAGAGGYRGDLYYLEGKGVLHESMVYAPFGIPADNIYVLTDGMIELKDQGEFSIDSEKIPEEGDFDPIEYGTFSWNGQTVTEEEYYEKVNEATFYTEGLPMTEIDWKSKEDILKELEG